MLIAVAGPLMLSRLTLIYTKLVFGRPILVLLVLLAITSVFAYHARNFRLDASADSLLLEGDKDLEYSRSINAR
jgi:predicted RND superfamily exporter protein